MNSLKQLKKLALFTLAIAALCFSPMLFAATPTQSAIPDLATMITNLSKAIPNLMQFVTALAYVMGMYFVVEGIIKLKKYGESRAGMSGEGNLKGPMMYLGVGAALMFLPSSVQVGMSTFWENPTPYAYVTDTLDPWSMLIQNIFLIIQLIGTIAFIRGLIILSHVGGQGSQPGAFGKAMAHIIGGVLCINIYQFIQAVLNTLALGQI
jgi:intracellular multiplication protein IcmC